MALQGDGKIVAVGTTNIHGSHTTSFAVARYRLNGSLDPSFSGDGKQTTELFFGEFASASGVAIQADGKIVAVGEASDFETFALARFNPNGSLDTSFSGDGLQTTDFGVGVGGATGVALQGDGKIVAVGYSFDPATFALARYNLDGSLDPSFSDDGLQTTDFLFGGGAEAFDVAIQANGRIVAVGVAGGGRHRQRLRARPLQHQRLARRQLLRGRQEANQLRRFRGREWGGAPGRRQDRRGRRRQRGVRACPLSGGLKGPVNEGGPQSRRSADREILRGRCRRRTWRSCGARRSVEPARPDDVEGLVSLRCGN